MSGDTSYRRIELGTITPTDTERRERGIDCTFSRSMRAAKRALTRERCSAVSEIEPRRELRLSARSRRSPSDRSVSFERRGSLVERRGSGAGSRVDWPVVVRSRSPLPLARRAALLFGAVAAVVTRLVSLHRVARVRAALAWAIAGLLGRSRTLGAAGGGIPILGPGAGGTALPAVFAGARLIVARRCARRRLALARALLPARGSAVVPLVVRLGRRLLRCAGGRRPFTPIVLRLLGVDGWKADGKRSHSGRG